MHDTTNDENTKKDVNDILSGYFDLDSIEMENE